MYLDPIFIAQFQRRVQALILMLKQSFDDSDQIRLAEFCKSINAIGAKFLLSNSDSKNIDPNDNFFDELYKGFTIKRINARRNINSDGSGRGIVSELLIKTIETINR